MAESLLVLCALIWVASVDKHHVITARNVILAFLLYLCGGLLVVTFSANSSFNPWWYVPVRNEAYTKAVFALLLFGASFLVMYKSSRLIRGPLSISKSLSKTVDRKLLISSGLFPLLIVGISIEAVAVVIFASHLGQVSRLWLRENVVEAYAGRGSLLILAGFGPSAVLFALVLSKGGKLRRLALWLLFFMTLGPYIITGQRGHLLSWLIIALVLWNSFVRKINFRRAVIIAMLLLILSFSYLAVRVSYRYGFDLHGAVYQSLRAHVSSEPYILLMAADGKLGIFGQWWDHLWAWVYMLIPRQIWAGKPMYSQISYRICEALTGMQGVGFTGSVIVTGLINAGWAGIILYGCILGIAAALLDRMYLLMPTGLVRASAFALALGWLIMFLRSGGVTESIMPMLLYVPVLLMAGFLQLGAKRVASSGTSDYRHNYANDVPRNVRAATNGYTKEGCK